MTSGSLLTAVVGLMLTTAWSADSEPPSSASKAEPEKHVRVLNGGTITGATPPGMVLVPGGRTKIGVGEKEMLELGSQEGYQHIKHVIGMYPEFEPDPEDRPGDLFVDIHETSNAQYKRFLDATGREPSQDLLENRWYYWSKGEKHEGLPPGQEDLPVGAVTFYEAQEAARWMGKRLPTEIEWEHIARSGAKPDQYYLWSDDGWAGWDRGRCSNLHNSNKGSEGMLPSAPGAYPEDATAHGVLDMCGNVSEWTSSRFDRYPGFEPIYYKRRGSKDKVKASGWFASDHYVIRGGNYMGNEVNCNVVFRNALLPTGWGQAVGFRGVISATPGLDRLKRAQSKELTLVSSDVKKKYDWEDKEHFASQMIWHTEEGQYVGQDVFAFARVKTLSARSEGALKKNSPSEPDPVGMFVTTQRVANPDLPPGAYVVYYRGEGETEAQREYRKEQRRNEPKDDEEKEADAEGEEGAAEEEEELSEEEKAAMEEERKRQEAIDRELEKVGAKPARPASSIDPLTLPIDENLLLIRDQSGNLVAFMPLQMEKLEVQPVRFGYEPGRGGLAGGAATNASTAGRADVDASQANDLATVVFPMIVGKGKKQMHATLPLEFAPGSFVAERLPDAVEGKKKR